MATLIPPFERFYEAHRVEVLGFLGRRLGRDRAEDAFQETFLRALRAYPRLEHGEHLRAWVLTIASRIVLDDVRRRRPPTTTDIEGNGRVDDPATTDSGLGPRSYDDRGAYEYQP